MLLDRLPERAALSALLEAARSGRSGVLVVRGEPGVGKTALLDWAVESAAGLRVVRVAASAPYGGSKNRSQGGGRGCAGRDCGCYSSLRRLRCQRRRRPGGAACRRPVA